MDKDLEREVVRYKVPFVNDEEYLNEETLDKIAEHFAKWGAEKQKEEMLKNAESCEIEYYDGLILNYTQKQLDDSLEKIGARVGDKVMMLIMPSDK